MLSFPVETDFTPIKRYEGFDQQHAVVGRGQASDSQHERSGGRYRERQQETPHDEAVLSAQAIEHQEASVQASSEPAAGALGTLGAWLESGAHKLLETLENMTPKS